MSDFQKQLVTLALDKGLLAFLVAVFAFCGKRYLDRLNTQNAYRQKLAEERLRAYKEISRIVAHQTTTMGWLPKILERVAELPEGESSSDAKDKLAQQLREAYNDLAASYRTEMPKIVADMIFISGNVGDLLIKYVDAFGGFMNVPHRMSRGESQPLPQPGLLALASQIQHAISTEIASLDL